MGLEPTSSKTQIYRIKIEGWLDKRWSDWLNGLAITPLTEADGSAVTCLTGVVADQPTLRGILSKLWDLNVTLISVNKAGGGDEEGIPAD